MVLHMKRFMKNQFFREKNPTIVNFPVKNLELADIIPVPAGIRPIMLSTKAALSVPNRQPNHSDVVSGRLEAMDSEPHGCQNGCQSNFACAGSASKYDLVANVVHEGLPDRGTYHAQVCSFWLVNLV